MNPLLSALRARRVWRRGIACWTTWIALSDERRLDLFSRLAAARKLCDHCMRFIYMHLCSVYMKRVLSRDFTDHVGPGVKNGFGVDVIEIGENAFLEVELGYDANVTKDRAGHFR